MTIPLFVHRVVLASVGEASKGNIFLGAQIFCCPLFNGLYNFVQYFLSHMSSPSGSVPSVPRVRRSARMYALSRAGGPRVYRMERRAVVE